MKWQVFVIQLLEAIAWPVALVVGITLFRRPIIKLIPTLRSARYKDLELQFGKRLDELGSQAEKAELPEPEARPAWVYESPDEWTFRDYIERLAPISPRVAIAEAWRRVELALRDAASRRGQRIPGDVMTLSRQLESGGILPRDAASLVRDLRPLRNQAIHAHELDLDPEQAIEFAALAERIIASIPVPPESE